MAGMGEGAPEQVYVYRGPDKDRPVIIHGWYGYRASVKCELTQRQAVELITLLVDAVLVA